MGFAHAQTIIRINRISYKTSEGKETTGSRIFISSLSIEQIGEGKTVAHIIRAHWDVENKNHWPRDALWREDHTRLRNSRVVRLLALLRGACLALIKGSAPDAFDAHRQNKRIPLAMLSRRSN